MHLSSLECKSEMLENEECSSSNSRNIDGFIGVVNFSSPSPFLFFIFFINIFLSLGAKNDKSIILTWYTKYSFNKPRTSTPPGLKFLDKVKSEISLSVFNNNLIIAHYNAADLSMLNDFEEVKKQKNEKKQQKTKKI